MKRSYRLLLSLALTIAFMACAGWLYSESNEYSDLAELTPLPEQGASTGEPVTPLPLALKLDPLKVSLGEQLFNDTKLSADGTISCAHCHNLSTGGTDRLVHSRGIGGKQGGINAPTVYNSGLNFRQFWNGRADTLEAQVDGPLQNPVEMGNTWPKALAALSREAQYRSSFAALYDDGIQPHNVRDAIATFERSLLTPNSRFDLFLRGDKSALNEEEQAGYRLFKQLGCISCHQGINIGGNMYQKLGIMEDYFAYRGNPTEADLGRFNVTRQMQDRYFFKVPSLRNVASTPPYLHDGSAKKLEDAVKVMARFQLGTQLVDKDVTRVVAFLHTLTGEYRGELLK